jgi:hypothetical protein
MKGAWSGGVLEEWSAGGMECWRNGVELKEGFFKVRTAATKLSSMQLLLRVSAAIFSDAPIIQYSSSLQEKE